jgi:dTDP-4-dehydrorhamnose reductase
MRLLVIGHSGQVATELARVAPEALFLGRESLDIGRPGASAKAIEEHRPEAVINAAAWTAVDKAEDEEDAAHALNADAPGEMARSCAATGIPFVHISTDYVFDGAGTAPFAPGDPTAPVSAYGRTKLDGERQVTDAAGVHAILRTSWVFSAHGANFVKTMLRLSETRDRLTVVADQIGGPTPAAAIARACLAIAAHLRTDPEASGVHHFSGAPDVSWADFAREIFAQAGRAVTVEDIPSSAYPTPATRPLNSRLDCGSLSRFGLDRPDWKAGLRDVLAELGAAR